MLLASHWTATFSPLSWGGSVCGPTLRVFCQHQLWGIYSLLPHVPGQPLDMAFTSFALQSPSIHLCHDINNIELTVRHRQVEGGVVASREGWDMGAAGLISEARLVTVIVPVQRRCQPWQCNMISLPPPLLGQSFSSVWKGVGVRGGLMYCKGSTSEVLVVL